jgi:hypothetical protein
MKITGQMKRRNDFLIFFLFLVSLNTIQAQKIYDLIPRKTSKVNNKLAAGLPPNIRAMAALYSAMGGTDCLEQQCVLTTALGLGHQGSDAQKALIQKYFPDDKVAQLVLGQNCYLPPGSSSSFSNFLSLSIVVNRDSVTVNYRLAVYDHGNRKILPGPDLYLFTHHVFKNKKRVLYAWVDKKEPVK